MIRALSPGPHRDTLSLSDLPVSVELAELGGTWSLHIASWSMFPTLLKGDIVEIAPAGEVTVGDIVVYRHREGLICHRVVQVGPGSRLRTRGDRCAGDGERTSRDHVIGVVCAVSRRGRRVEPTGRRPSWLSRIRLRLDLFQTCMRERSRALLGETLALLARSATVRGIVVGTLRPHLTFSIGFLAPVRAVQAYRFVELGPSPISPDTVRNVSCARFGPETLLLRMSVWGTPLRTLDLATGEVIGRRVAASFGLDDVLHSVAAQVQPTRRLDAAASHHLD